MADEGKIDDNDDDILLDHVALECMHAIEAKDIDRFVDAFHMLVGDLINRIQSPKEGE